MYVIYAVIHIFSYYNVLWDVFHVPSKHVLIHIEVVWFPNKFSQYQSMYFTKVTECFCQLYKGIISGSLCTLCSQTLKFGRKNEGRTGHWLFYWFPKRIMPSTWNHNAWYNHIITPFDSKFKTKNYKNIWNILKIKITVNMIDIMILSK